MTTKLLNGECLNCESSYNVQYIQELVSQDYPEHCPFCGEIIEELQEEYIEDDEDELDTGEWD
jgi:predicted  nucleic acid-binding Zn-ribbon protein